MAIEPLHIVYLLAGLLALFIGLFLLAIRRICRTNEWLMRSHLGNPPEDTPFVPITLQEAASMAEQGPDGVEPALEPMKTIDEDEDTNPSE